MPKPTTLLPKTEVKSDPKLERRSRRTFSRDYKLSIIRQADACQHGEIGSPLRSPLDALIRMTKGIGVFMWMCHVIALAWVIFGAPLAWNEAYLLLPQNWGDRTLSYLLYHGFFLALPGFFYSWAFFSWLIQLTSIKVEWPSEIQQRLGAPTMGGGH
jgi:hypothetical protein